jgi:hypothetical protein
MGSHWAKMMAENWVVYLGSGMENLMGNWMAEKTANQRDLLKVLEMRSHWVKMREINLEMYLGYLIE